MDEKEIIKEFDKIKKRLDKLEGKNENVPVIRREETPSKKNSLKGISKGIQDLINKGFFDKPKQISESITELNKEGYFGSKQSVDSSIRKVFFKSKKTLTRIKEENKWKYVVRR